MRRSLISNFKDEYSRQPCISVVSGFAHSAGLGKAAPECSK